MHVLLSLIRAVTVTQYDKTAMKGVCRGNAGVSRAEYTAYVAGTLSKRLQLMSYAHNWVFRIDGVVMPHENDGVSRTNIYRTKISPKSSEIHLITILKGKLGAHICVLSS
jgi:hypothetical protein